MELALLVTYKVDSPMEQLLHAKLVQESTEQIALLANLITFWSPLLLGVAKLVDKIATSVQLLDQAFVILALLDIML
jgi:hypothetical protein